MPPQPTGNPMWRNGLIFGAIIAVLSLGNTFIQWISGAYSVMSSGMNGSTNVGIFNSGPSSLLGCVVFLATLGLTFVAGMLTARRTGTAGTGALTGLIAGLFGALIGGGASLVVLLVLVAPSVQVPPGSPLTPGQLQALIIGSAIFGAVIGVLFDGGIGAGMGALGGLVGRDTYRKAMPAYVAPPYPGMYPGMPGQPSAYPPPPYAPPGYPPYPPPGYPPYPPSSPYPPQEPPQSGFSPPQQ